MKIKISTIVDVPDTYLDKNNKYVSAVECVSDYIISYLKIRHIEDSSKWFVASKDKESPEFRLYKIHHDWYEICNNLKWAVQEAKTHRTQLEEGK